MKYAIITNSENGDGVSVDIVDKHTLLDRITPDGDGYTYYGKKKILTKYPDDRINTENFDTDYILILEVSIPNIVAKKVITRYEIEDKNER